MTRTHAVYACTLAVTLAVAVAALAVAARAAAPQYPVSDIAVTESYTILAGQGRLLVGPYSRFSWHHPGPFYFYCLWPFYAAARSNTWGLSVGAWFIYCASFLTAVYATRFSPRGVLTFGLGVLAAITTVRFPGLLTSPWNPHVVLMPMLLLPLCGAAVCAGRFAWIIACVVVWSFVVQTHVSTAVPATLALLIAFAVGWTKARSLSDPIQRRKAAILFGASVIVLGSTWVLPLIEQFSVERGNLSMLWAYFTRPVHDHLSGAAAFGVLSDAATGLFNSQYALAQGQPIAWTGSEISLSITAGLLLLLALFLAGARPAQWQFDRWLAALLATELVAAWWSITRIDGAVFDHVVFWLCGIGALAIVLLTHWLLTSARSPRLDAHLMSVSIALCGTLSLYQGAVRLPRMMSGSSESPASRTVRVLAAKTIDYVQQTKIKPLLLVPQDSWELTAGMVVQLQKAGIDFAVEPAWLDMFTTAMSPTGAESMTLTIAQSGHSAELGEVVAEEGHTVVVASTIR